MYQNVRSQRTDVTGVFVPGSVLPCSEEAALITSGIGPQFSTSGCQSGANTAGPRRCRCEDTGSTACTWPAGVEASPRATRAARGTTAFRDQVIFDTPAGLETRGSMQEKKNLDGTVARSPHPRTTRFLYHVLASSCNGAYTVHPAPHFSRAPTEEKKRASWR